MVLNTLFYKLLYITFKVYDCKHLNKVINSNIWSPLINSKVWYLSNTYYMFSIVKTFLSYGYYCLCFFFQYLIFFFVCYLPCALLLTLYFLYCHITLQFSLKRMLFLAQCGRKDTLYKAVTAAYSPYKYHSEGQKKDTYVRRLVKKKLENTHLPISLVQ